MLITCPTCNGNQGEYVDVDLFNPCGACDGTGEIEIEPEPLPDGLQPIESEVQLPRRMDLGPLLRRDGPKFY